MNPLLNLIQQQEKEFDDKFACTCGGQPCGSVSYEGCIDDIKSFHRATIISLLEGEIEKWNKKIFNYDDVWTDWGRGRNDAILEIISSYQSVLDGLKKSV